MGTVISDALIFIIFYNFTQDVEGLMFCSLIGLQRNKKNLDFTCTH